MSNTESFTQMTIRFATNVTKAAFKLLGYTVDESELEKAVKGLVVQQKKVYILWNTTKNEHGIHFQQKDESAIMELLTDITGISQKKLCRKWQGVSFPHAQEENITSVLEEAGYNVCKKEAAEFDGPVWNELSVVEEAKLKAETLGARKVKTKPPTSITNEDLQELIASEVKSRKTGSKSKLDDWDPSKSSSSKAAKSGKSATKSAKPAAPKAKKSTTGKSSGASSTARVPTKKNRWGNFVEDTYNLAFFDFFTTESKDKVQVCIGVQNTDLDTPDKGGDGGFATLLPIYDHLDLVKLFEKKSGKKINLLDYDFAQTIKSEKLYDSLAEAELFLIEDPEEEELEEEGDEDLEEEDQEEAPEDEDLEEEDLFEEGEEEDLEEEEEEEF